MSQTRRRRRTGAERKEFREGLLKSAAATFLDLGLRDAKMDDVAERAGESKVVLYRHFASKDDLIHSILEREASRLMDLDREPYPGGYERARELLDVARLDQASFVLLMRDSRHDPVYGEHTEVVLNAIASRLQRAFAKNGLDDPFAELSAMSIVTLVFESVLFWLQQGDGERDDEFVAWYAEGMRSLDASWRKPPQS